MEYLGFGKRVCKSKTFEKQFSKWHVFSVSTCLDGTRTAVEFRPASTVRPRRRCVRVACVVGAAGKERRKAREERIAAAKERAPK